MKSKVSPGFEKVCKSFQQETQKSVWFIFRCVDPIIDERLSLEDKEV